MSDEHDEMDLSMVPEKQGKRAMEEAVKEKTVIAIAHRLSTIKNADKIMVLEDGRVVETGKLDELLRNKGIFHRYWEAQKF